VQRDCGISSSDPMVVVVDDRFVVPGVAEALRAKPRRAAGGIGGGVLGARRGGHAAGRRVDCLPAA
jgi:hypothetical protein